MRKHFLLLFLMAILPLAGWAADLDVTKFTAPNMTYHEPVALSVSNTQGLDGDDYSVETTKYYTGYTGSAPALIGTGETPVANLATAPVGTYYVKVVGKGDYVGQTIFVSFHVNGKEITATDIAAIANQTYTGGELKPEPVVTVGGNTLVKGTDYTVEWSNNINVNVAPATALVTVTGIGNYSGEPKKEFNIVPKTFNTTNITVAVSNNEVTYDGTDTQTATVVVTDKELGVLTEDDYEVAYEGTHDIVGEYTITVTGKRNYSADDIDADKKLVIGKATLLVAPKLTKVYDGDVTSKKLSLDAATEFVYTGLVDATAPTVAATVQVDITSPKRDVDTYVATVKASTADGITAGGNYTIITQPGTFTITKKPLYVYANNQNVEYGSSIVTNDMTVEDHSSTSADPITGWASTATPAYTGDLDNIKKAVIVYEDTDHKLKVKANDACTDAAALKVLGNYTVNYNYNTNTIVPATTPKKFGTLTTGKRNITIALNATKVTLTKEYDGQPAAIAEDVKDAANLTIIGETVEGDDLDLSGLTATVATNTGAVTDGTLIKPYKVTLAGATVSANADKYTINYVTTYYTVTKKALTFTVPQQSAKVGTPVATAFDKTKFTVEGLLEADGSKDGIFELKLDAAAIDGDNIKNVATDNYVSIAVKTGATPAETAAIAAKAANYSWTTTDTYKLVIVPAAAIVLDDSKDLSTLAAAANATVTFTTRELEEGVWTTMVLPFEATVRQISKALGYAVVDMLQPTGNEMNFKIFMGTIPAYTPFLVKTDANVNMNTVVFTSAGSDHFNIEALAAVGGNRDNLTQSNDSYNFIGKVDKAPITTNFWAVGSKMTKETFKFDGVKAETGETSALRALRAYITAKTGVQNAPIINIEEPDGSTTSIGAITAEGRLVEADGWYTLNGVKLQGAPTQKGIYIRNGKKLVVK